MVPNRPETTKLAAGGCEEYLFLLNPFVNPPSFLFSLDKSRALPVGAKKSDRPCPTRAVQSAGATLPGPPAVAEQDGGGWEMVRGRTRSRTSPAKGAQPALMRASTVIYTSRLEANKHPSSSSKGDGETPQQKRRTKLLKPATAQSLPSLCDRPKDEEKLMATPVALRPPSTPSPIPPTQQVDEAPIVDLTTDEETDEAGEEAEMARREEALTAEEEHLQREMRETERSDNEADDLWDERINVTPVR